MVRDVKSALKKPKKRKPAARYSPKERCAGKCRHHWCAGYDAGYEDGQADAQEEQNK